MNAQSSIKRNVTFSEYEPLAIALYVRDTLGLAQLVQLPRLEIHEPNSDDISDHELDQLNNEWLLWWTEIVERSSETFKEVGAPIDYLSFLTNKPALRPLVIPIVEAAREWHDSSRDADGSFRRPDSPDFLPPLALKLAGSVPKRHLQAAYANIAFAVLPLKEKTGWQLGPSLFAVSKSLVRDQAAFKDWFTSALQAGNGSNH
ncbi:hypothetical protein [Arthrobacter sp. UYEF3]|uniref:hypothetical protein n=1 Tax=Arthrobacter sp. UYEF3 TaxID=1756365 RepID=UPI003399A7BC